LIQSQNGAPIDPKPGDTTKQILDGIEKQGVSLDGKLDTIAAKMDSKDDLGDLKRDIQQLRDEIHEMAAKQRQPSACLSDTLSDTDDSASQTSVAARNTAITCPASPDGSVPKEDREPEEPKTRETDASTPAELSPLSEDEQRRLASFNARPSIVLDILPRLVPTKTEEGGVPRGHPSGPLQDLGRQRMGGLVDAVLHEWDPAQKVVLRSHGH
jgi:hypothetical protein